jgi:hypothetical protein
MTKKRITKQTCEQAMQAAQLLGDPLILFDDKLAGFGFRAAPRGERASAFFCDYRLKTRGKDKLRHTLGKFAALTPASAREKAQEFLGEISKGNDPLAEKIAHKEKEAGIKFGELWAAYFDFKDDGSRYWRDIRGCYRREVPNTLNTRAAALVTRADLRNMVDATRQKKSPNVERWLYEPLNGIFGRSNGGI